MIREDALVQWSAGENGPLRIATVKRVGEHSAFVQTEAEKAAGFPGRWVMLDKLSEAKL